MPWLLCLKKKFFPSLYNLIHKTTVFTTWLGKEKQGLPCAGVQPYNMCSLKKGLEYHKLFLDKTLEQSQALSLLFFFFLFFYIPLHWRIIKIVSWKPCINIYYIVCKYFIRAQDMVTGHHMFGLGCGFFFFFRKAFEVIRWYEFNSRSLSLPKCPLFPAGAIATAAKRLRVPRR